MIPTIISAMVAAAQAVRLQWKVGLLLIGAGFGVGALVFVVIMPNTGCRDRLEGSGLELRNPWGNKCHRYTGFLRSCMSLVSLFW